MAASNLTVLDLQEHREVTEAQIPNELPRMGMDRPGLPTDMTEGLESPVGFDADDRRTRTFDSIRVRDSHSSPGEKTCYTASGHRASPFETKQRSSINVCLAPGKPVSTSFHAIKSATFGEENHINIGLARMSTVESGAITLVVLL